MKVIIILSFILSFLYSEEQDNLFITKFEYGAMLYKNPRGIGCNKCHANGKKTIQLAKYQKLNKQNNKLENINIMVPPINIVTFQQFKTKLTADKRDSLIMPTYFLTQDELKSIYFYIKNIKY